jgi:hypothetical protein
MEKGFGIAALIVAIVACFVPVFGIYVSALALVVAAIGALAGDRIFAVAVPVLAGINTFVLTPSFWIMMAGAEVQKISGLMFALVFCFLALPIVGILIAQRRAVPNPVRGSTQAPLSNRAAGPMNLPAGDAGEDTWHMISSQTDRSLFEEFLLRFPDHPRAMMAKLALGRLADAAAMPALPATGAQVVRTTPPASSSPQSSPLGPYIVLFTMALGTVAFFMFGLTNSTDYNSVSSRPASQSEPAQPPQSILASPPSAIQAPVKRPDPRLSIRARPETIRVGSEETTITWEASNVDDCTVDGPNGYRQPNSMNGSVTGTLNEVGRVVFTLYCVVDGSNVVASTHVTATKKEPRLVIGPECKTRKDCSGTDELCFCDN